jgi:hypothetical protein
VADISRWEDQELEYLEEADELVGEIEKAEQKLQEEQKKLEQIKQQVNEKTTEYDERIERLRREEDGLRDEIDPKALKTYDHIAASRGSTALVRMKNRVCMGCHTTLPKQVENTLMQGEDIIFCSTCGRMLIRKEDAIDPSFENV